MITVWKYKLRIGGPPIEMPRRARLLHVAPAPEGDPAGPYTLALWALVDTEAQKVMRSIRVFATGEAVADGFHAGHYVDTAIVGPLVWHIFDGGELG